MVPFLVSPDTSQTASRSSPFRRLLAFQYSAFFSSNMLFFVAPFTCRHSTLISIYPTLNTKPMEDVLLEPLSQRDCAKERRKISRFEKDSCGHPVSTGNSFGRNGPHLLFSFSKREGPQAEGF